MPQWFCLLCHCQMRSSFSITKETKVKGSSEYIWNFLGVSYQVIIANDFGNIFFSMWAPCETEKDLTFL